MEQGHGLGGRVLPSVLHPVQAVFTFVHGVIVEVIIHIHCCEEKGPDGGFGSGRPVATPGATEGVPVRLG
jgi:hypothetical protein